MTREWLCFRYNAETVDINDLGGYTCRHPCLIKIFELAHSEACKQGKLDFDFQQLALYTGDKPPSEGASLFPEHKIMSICNTRDKAHRCFPCFNFWNWEDAGIPDFQTTLDEIHTKRQNAPTTNKLFWIGNLGTHRNRTTFWKISRQHRDLCKCVPMKWTGFAKASEYVSLPDHTQYSMLIDIEGNGYSGRLKFLAHMDRLLFVQNRPYWDWAGSLLVPKEHYIPVDRLFTDLVSKVTTVMRENTTTMQESCKNFAQASLTREKAVEHAVELI